jgi:hypothetical protein
MSDINEFKLLRWKGPDATADVDTDDFDYYTLGLPPNTGRYTVGSAENGTFSIIASDEKSGLVIGTSSYEHAAAETDAETAEALADQINADIAAGTPNTLAGIAESAYYPGSGAILYVRWNIDHKPFTVSVADPGSATLAQYPTNRFPSAVVVPFDRRAGLGPVARIELNVVALDSSLAPLLSAGTYAYQIVEAIKVYDVHGRFSHYTIGTRGSGTGTMRQDIHVVDCNGAHQIGVRLTTISEPASTDRIAVYWRPVVS